MVRRIGVLVLLGVIVMAASGSDDLPDISALFPGEAQGWKPAGPPEIYDRDNLFDLIDGGAEVYRALNVHAVFSRRYVKPGAPEIIADIFDMGTAQDAFGAYHHDMREGKDAGVGQESELLGGNLTFWKDRFFVAIVPLDDTEELRRAVLDLSRAIAGAISGEGAKPDLVALLPDKDLVSSQVHYFHDKTLLDRHLTIGRENILGLSKETEGLLARYRRPAGKDGKKASGTAALLLIRYGSAEKAGRVCKALLDSRISGAGEDGSGRTENGQWAGARSGGRLLAIVMDASSRERVQNLLDEVDRRLLKSKRPKGEEE